MDLTDKIAAMNAAKQAADEKAENQAESFRNTAAIIGTLKQVVHGLIQYLDQKEITASVNNFPDSINVPDVDKVVKEIRALTATFEKKPTEDTKTHKLLENLSKALEKLPKSFPEIPKMPKSIEVSNQIDFKPDIQEVVKAVKALELHVEPPKVTVKPTDVVVQSDFTKLEEQMSILTAAVNAIELVVPVQDDTAVIAAVQEVKEAISSLIFPVPNYVFPFKDPNGKASQAQVDSQGYIAQRVFTYRYDVQGTTIYEARAAVGTAENTTGWEITKYDLTDMTDASGKVATDVSWDNRATGSYA